MSYNNNFHLRFRILDACLIFQNKKEKKLKLKESSLTETRRYNKLRDFLKSKNFCEKMSCKFNFFLVSGQGKWANQRD